MKSFVFGALAVAVLGACGGNSTNAPAALPAASANTSLLPTQVTLAQLDLIELTRANLRIRFDSTLSDSRCPSSVQCIQAGSALVQFTVTHISGSDLAQYVRLENAAGKDTATVFGQLFRLVRVDPARVTTDRIPMSAYHVVLEVGADK